ncbi:MAG: 1-acyl-sn-glycerol-3-phosphate acyltransferase [Rhodospirillaceae bacterium]|nr:1-acyl-sn-glycerol-3-phosphate acyltransferase [Rhodospirillaceae bacterium]|tara:strand:+ start:3578 stop:4462 length:885 start_codon:yes stop_codon:yes gene_type:complete
MVMTDLTNFLTKKGFRKILDSSNHGKFIKAIRILSSFKWLSGLRLAKYTLITVFLIPGQIAIMICYPRLAQVLPRFHHKVATKLLGLRVTYRGYPITKGGILYVANHISYLDIIALGSILPARFIAKSDVAGWPIFGFLSKITRTIFLDRLATRAHQQISLIKHCLQKSEPLLLFPEGTSSDGSRVLPFKTSLFAAPKAADALIQPITIQYTRLNGMPIERSKKPLLAWYGNMDLAPHLWQALSLGTVDVEIQFHETVQPSNFSDRKQLAQHCRKKITAGMSLKNNTAHNLTSL